MKYLLILRLHARFLLHYVKILFKYFYLSISSYSRGFIDSLHRSFQDMLELSSEQYH